MKNPEKSHNSETQTTPTSGKTNTSSKNENGSQDKGKKEAVPNIEAEGTKSKSQDSKKEKSSFKK
jgi:hypothetical protein